MNAGVAGGFRQTSPPQTTHFSFEVQVQALLALDYDQPSLPLAKL